MFLTHNDLFAIVQDSFDKGTLDIDLLIECGDIHSCLRGDG